MTIREIALDTETTGFEPSHGHKIVEIGCVEMINRVRTGEIFHVYINPQREVPEAAFNVHGLSTQFLFDKPLFEEVANDFLEFIGGDTLVIHNSDFDMKFLNAELENMGRDIIPYAQALCTLRMARKKFPGGQASLDALCRKFNIDTSSRTLHGALLDAELLADMYLEITGGPQVKFSFNEKENKKESSSDNVNKSKITVEPRSFPATEEENSQHKEFIKKIDKPIWENN